VLVGREGAEGPPPPFESTASSLGSLGREDLTPRAPSVVPEKVLGALYALFTLSGSLRGKFIVVCASLPSPHQSSCLEMSRS